MRCHVSGWTLIPALLLGCACGEASLGAQVFVVGEKTATEDISTSFTPTRLALPTDPLTERGRRQLIRDLEDEQGFAHRVLPMGAGLTLEANGNLSPGPEEYRRMIYRKGESAAPGDRVVITAVHFKGNRIVLDFNGGPYERHRFLRHIQINGNNLVAPTDHEVTGCRITLEFEGQIPEVSAPEVKALLQPVVDFGARTTEQAYADTLPAPIRDAVAAHEVLVGMNHRMVLAAMGEPENKIREHPGDNPDAPRYEEWIYGHVPQTVRFVRFRGDRVVRVETAAMGRPLEVRDRNEMGNDQPEPPTHEIALGDTNERSAPPTLRKPGEPAAPGAAGKVQFPTTNGATKHP